MLQAGAPPQQQGMIHRLDKADTADGLSSIHNAAKLHVPYSMLLYERYLGRPYASHRDAVSELVGDLMENAIEQQLATNGISHRKTGRAERIKGFDQAPDFIVPDEFTPAVVIEAKLTNDDGTARDKHTRLTHLAEMRDERERAGKPSFEVVACIDGRGFGVRRADMKKLIKATRGKVFTFATLDRLLPRTLLAVCHVFFLSRSSNGSQHTNWNCCQNPTRRIRLPTASERRVEPCHSNLRYTAVVHLPITRTLSRTVGARTLNLSG